MYTVEHRFLARMAARVDAWPPATARLLALVSIPLLGYIDYVTGPDVAFSVFYLLPIAVIGWIEKEGRFFPMAAALLSAITWLAADLGAGADYSSPLVPIWNTLTRLMIFSIVLILLQNLHTAVAEQRLLAATDPMTGVANSRSFMDALGNELRRARRHPAPISVAYIDVDDFKTINDTVGHAGGDEVLQRVATALDKHTREVDLVGRLGGDEFAILLPLTDEEGAKVVLGGLHERVRAAMRGLDLRVTFSAGCVTFREAPAGIGTILHAADELMYEVKRGGKDSVLHRVVDPAERVS